MPLAMQIYLATIDKTTDNVRVMSWLIIGEKCYLIHFKRIVTLPRHKQNTFSQTRINSDNPNKFEEKKHLIKI